jgi:predicted nucleotidyltransferase
MTEADAPLIGRADLERAFTLLGERLVRRGVVGDLFVVGGAAIALAYDAKRVTRDVDALYVPHGIVHEEAVEVARELGLPRWWLNEQASVYISGADDPERRRVFDHPGLRVSAASPRHIFAMKALAARERDVPDLRLLADIADIDSLEVAVNCAREFFPDEVMPERARRVLAELFAGA